eukprot:3648855-Amphidinium_carterae.1
MSFWGCMLHMRSNRSGQLMHLIGKRVLSGCLKQASVEEALHGVGQSDRPEVLGLLHVRLRSNELYWYCDPRSGRTMLKKELVKKSEELFNGMMPPLSLHMHTL